MTKLNLQKYFLPGVLFIVATLWLSNPTSVFAGMGMSWSDVSGVESAADVCPEPDFTQMNDGPFDRPLRLASFSDNDLIVADYRLGKMFLVSMADPDNPTVLFDVGGRPMGVAVADSRRRKVVFTGNDSSDKIDVYLEKRRFKRDKTTKLRVENVEYKKRFSFPRSRTVKVQALDIEVDSAEKKIFVVDGLKKEIQVYNFRGRLLSAFGAHGDLTTPKGLAIDSVSKEVFVSDYGDVGRGISASIQTFDYSGRKLQSITGEFGRPQGVDVTSSSILVVDSLLGQILEFDRSTGNRRATHGCIGSGAGQMRLPRDLFYNASLETVFVADFRNRRITTVDVKGISP